MLRRWHGALASWSFFRLVGLSKRVAGGNVSKRDAIVCEGEVKVVIAIGTVRKQKMQPADM